MILNFNRTARIVFIALISFFLTKPASAVIRDGGIDPANLGKGDWVYYLSALTSGLGGNVPSVTNIASFMAYEKSQGIRYIIVKAASGSEFFPSNSNRQFNQALVDAAHAEGLLIFGYNRSGQGGVNVAGEVAVADYVFQQGADGYVWDAESEWEVQNVPDNLNLAWQICGQTRTNWPTKLLAHAPFDIVSYHSSFPYKEFGYWCDVVMPQIYHFGRTNIKRSPSGNINWADANWKSWQDGLTGMWTNSIKPLAPVNHVYGPNPPNSGVSHIPDEQVGQFVDHLVADPHGVTAGGYKGASFWRADLHGVAQWEYIKQATIGDFPGIVNNIVIDNASATLVGAWTSVKIFSNGTYFGTTETNTFGTNYFYKAQGSGAAYVQYTPNVVVAGNYDVYEWHPNLATGATNVPHVINYHGGSATVYVNQQINYGLWNKLGRFNFAAGTSGNIRVMDNFSDAGSVAMSDGIKLIYVPPVTDLILDNTDSQVTFVGDWQSGSGASDKFGADYRFASVDSGGASNVTYRPNLDLSGYYDVFIWYPQGVNRAPDAPWTIHYNGGSTNVSVNQQSNGGQWNLVGSSLPFLRGTNGDVQLSNNASPKVVLADAVRFVYVSGFTAPNILAGPQHQTARVGTNITFRVTADGTAPLIYQWHFNGTTIPTATESAYTRFNVQTNDAGTYSVTITNAVDFEASSNAILTVTIPQRAQFQSVTHDSVGGVNLILSGDTGISYSVDRSTNLIDWETLTNMVNSNGTIQFFDPSATNWDKTFYRARE